MPTNFHVAYGSLFLFLFLLYLCLYFVPFTKKIEGFDSTYFNSLRRIEGEYPKSVNQAILDEYPLIGKNEVSNNSASSNLQRYPIFTFPSFSQKTNNLRYRYNPDDGSCTRPEFCGALYHNIKNNSNEVYPLPPAEEGLGARVGYFRSETNILNFSIPTNENILY